MRTLGIAALTLLCIALLSPSIVYSADLNKTLHNKCIYPTVKVEIAAETADDRLIGSQITGSGVIIKSVKLDDCYANIVITCCHVIRTKHMENFIKMRLGGERYIPKFKVLISVAKYKNWSVFKKYEKYVGLVVSFHEENDLAIVMFRSDKKMHTADIEFNPVLYLGSDIFKIGCGLGDQPRLDYGKITSLNTDVDGPGIKGSVRINAATIGGDSGGPVFHNNKVIGLTFAVRHLQRVPIFHMGYFRPMKDLKEWDNKENNDLSFIYKEDKLPAIPLAQLKFGEYKAKKGWLPDSRWRQEIISKHKVFFQ